MPPYVLAGRYACPVHHIAVKAGEGPMNRELALLGSSPKQQVRKMVIAALFPAVDDPACDDPACHSEVSFVRESGACADFHLICPVCGEVRALTEHKPRQAPAQWSRAVIEDYRSPVVLGAATWVNALPDPHQPATCTGGHPVSRDTRGQPGCRLVAPQVLVYTNRHRGLPVTIINDSGLDVSSLYDTEGAGDGDQDYPFRLDSARFPIIGTDTVINRLAAEADRVVLGEEDRHVLRCIMEALWMRASWSVDEGVDEQARGRWIRPAVLACANDAGCPTVRWSDYDGPDRG